MDVDNEPFQKQQQDQQQEQETLHSHLSWTHTRTGTSWIHTPPRGDVGRSDGKKQKKRSWEQYEEKEEEEEEKDAFPSLFASPSPSPSPSASPPAPPPPSLSSFRLSSSTGTTLHGSGGLSYERLRRSARRIEMTRSPSPLGMQYAMDGYQEERHQQALACVEGNRRFLESPMGARLSFERAENDLLYRILFHYNDYGMDRELDAAIDFVLQKYALGALIMDDQQGEDMEEGEEQGEQKEEEKEKKKIGQDNTTGIMYPPLALHPNGALAGKARPDHTLHTDCYGWPPANGHTIPDSIRNVSERKLFADRRDRWFVRDTFQYVRLLPRSFTLYKRFLLVVLVAMEPELFERVAAHCPPELVMGHENDQGMTLQQVMEALTKELVAQFNQYTAVATIQGYMTRIINTYDMGGVIR